MRKKTCHLCRRTITGKGVNLFHRLCHKECKEKYLLLHPEFKKVMQVAKTHVSKTGS
jgi:hypothetical protein